MNNESRTRIIQLNRNIQKSYEKRVQLTRSLDHIENRLENARSRPYSPGCCRPRTNPLIQKIQTQKNKLIANLNTEREHTGQLANNWFKITRNVWKLVYPGRLYTSLNFLNWWKANQKKYEARTGLRIHHPNLSPNQMNTVRKLLVKTIKERSING